MFCPECGTENPDDARFCGSCGAPIPAPNGTTMPEPDKVARFVDLEPAQDGVPGGLKYGVVAATLFMPLIGVLTGLYFMVKGESESKKAAGRLWLYIGIGVAVFYLMVGSGGF